MGARATSTSKGQVAVPQEVLRRLGLRKGDRIEFVLEDSVTILRAARDDYPKIPDRRARGIGMGKKRFRTASPRATTAGTPPRRWLLSGVGPVDQVVRAGYERGGV